MAKGKCFFGFPGWSISEVAEGISGGWRVGESALSSEIQASRRPNLKNHQSEIINHQFPIRPFLHPAISSRRPPPRSVNTHL
jgi:hypothetical protein